MGRAPEVDLLLARRRRREEDRVLQNLVDDLVEGLGHADGRLRGGLDEHHARAPRPVRGLGPGHDGVAVDLVADEELDDLGAAAGRVDLDLAEPLLEVVEGLAPRDVVDEDDPLRAAVVR